MDGLANSRELSHPTFSKHMVIKCQPSEPSPHPGGLGGKTQTPDTQKRIPPKAWLPELSPTVLLAEVY